MRAAILALCLLTICGTSNAEKIFRWNNADGKVVYGDLPPSGARNVVQIDRRTARDNKTQAPDTNEIAASQIDARSAECDQKRSQLETYRNASRLVEKDSLGNEREYTAEEKALLIGRTEVEIDVLCGGVEE